MQLVLDRKGCSGCNTCIEVCPYKPVKTKIADFINCPCDSKKCIYACPKKAIEEHDGIILINREKCDSCGKCIEACPNKAIARNKKGEVVKCDLCFEHGYPKCVQSCPYNALTYEMDGNEKEKMREWIGWEKTDSGVYEAKVKRIGFEEAKIINSCLNVFRQNHSEYSIVNVENIVKEYCEEKNIVADKNIIERILKIMESEINGYSVLDAFLEDEELEEIAVIRYDKPIYVYHKDKGWLESNVIINNPQKIIDITNRMSRELGRRITLQKPRLNANIKLGRIHASMEPIAYSGACLTIRKFKKKSFTPEDLIDNNTISSEAMQLLSMAMRSDLSILIVGNTGSGKTTLMNSLFQYIPTNERIIIVEETPEINIPHQHQIRLNVSEDLNIGMHELISDTLRMRPDRVIVGEVRTADELKAFMNTMLAGQGRASYASFHAQNAQEALIRMQSMGINPMDLNALDLIITQRRWAKKDGKGEIRKVIEICSIEKDYSSAPSVRSLFKYNVKKDKLEKKKLEGETIEKICLSYGISPKDIMRVEDVK